MSKPDGRWDQDKKRADVAEMRLARVEGVLAGYGRSPMLLDAGMAVLISDVRAALAIDPLDPPSGGTTA